MGKKRLFIGLMTALNLFACLFFYTGNAKAEGLQPFTDFASYFTFPPELKDNWTARPPFSDPQKGLSCFIFSRKTITDQEGSVISPAISFIFEQAPPPPNGASELTSEEKFNFIMAYSTYKRVNSPIPFTIDKVYAGKNDLFAWDYAIGFKVHYTDKGKEHTIYLVYGMLVRQDKAYGVQVILDSTTSVFADVDPEFKAILANLGKEPPK